MLLWVVVVFGAVCVWLSGHWVGRVAAFLVMMATFSGLGLAANLDQPTLPASILILGASGVAAWYLSAIPGRVRRPRLVIYPPRTDLTVLR